MTQAIRPATINCARCGKEKAVGRSGPIPTYCSGACRAALKYERSRQDGRYEQELAAARHATEERRLANTRPCPYCGAPMSNPRRVQCGQPDCRRRFNADRGRAWQAAHKEQTGQWYHSNYNYTEQRRAYYKRVCQELGHWRRRHPDKAATYDARRRALIQQARTAETFAPAEVHARDHWTCQLCHLPIDPAVVWPDVMSPSIDHVIPLSRGGAHSLANVQSAHLGCNSSKGDKLLIEFIRQRIEVRSTKQEEIEAS